MKIFTDYVNKVTNKVRKHSSKRRSSDKADNLESFLNNS